MAVAHMAKGGRGLRKILRGWGREYVHIGAHGSHECPSSGHGSDEPLPCGFGVSVRDCAQCELQSFGKGPLCWEGGPGKEKTFTDAAFHGRGHALIAAGRVGFLIEACEDFDIHIVSYVFDIVSVTILIATLLLSFLDVQFHGRYFERESKIPEGGVPSLRSERRAIWKKRRFE
jgi:hypothetical protein